MYTRCMLEKDGGNNLGFVLYLKPQPSIRTGSFLSMIEALLFLTSIHLVVSWEVLFNTDVCRTK